MKQTNARRSPHAEIVSLRVLVLALLASLKAKKTAKNLKGDAEFNSPVLLVILAGLFGIMAIVALTGANNQRLAFICTTVVLVYSMIFFSLGGEDRQAG